jgi:ANTAR domain
MPTGSQDPGGTPATTRPAAGPGPAGVPGGAPASPRGRAAEAREEARRLRGEATATRAGLAARRAWRAGDTGPPPPGGSRHGRLSRLAAAEHRSAQLERALASNRRIGIAIGVLMTRLHVTDAEALGQLRDASQRRNVKLSRLAEEVIRTGTI